MFASIIVLAILIQASLSCDFPNGTETAVNWWDCGSGGIKIYSITPLDNDGNFQYPIHLAQPMWVEAEIDNTVKDYTSADDLIIDILIWQYSGWANCKWTAVPTFACSNGLTCPIPRGRQTIRVNLDFTVHKQIVSLLKNDAPYQLQYKVTDKSTGRYGCATFQVRAYTK
uniref:ML domain-containing protein n=1 Tax=Syphacia muris TaxID=451379 RepID=A0A0N5ATQ6_9BILA